MIESKPYVIEREKNEEEKTIFYENPLFFNSKQLIVDINISHILQQIFDSDFLSKHGT